MESIDERSEEPTFAHRLSAKAMSKITEIHAGLRAAALGEGVADSLDEA